MKLKLCAFLLLASLTAYAQHGGTPGGGHGMGAPAGSPPSTGAGHGMSGEHGQGGPGSDMGMGSRPSSVGKQTPDQMLSRNSQLSSKLDSLLPNGENAQQACSGYKNLGQCVSAIHVSKNLGIPFDDLKAKTTGSGAVSLGKAIHELKPDANAKAEVKKANQQAKQDLNKTNS